MTEGTPNVKISQKDDRTWAMICHLSALCAFLAIPFGNILGPLIVWLLKKNESPLVDIEGRKALNFQISMTIYSAVAGVLCFVFIGFLLLVPLVLADLILTIIAGIKASNGEEFKYPFTIELIK